MGNACEVLRCRCDGFSLLPELEGRDLAQFRMTPARVVPALDPGSNGETGLDLGPETAAIEQFAFPAGQVALRHRVVVGIADGPHRRPHAHVLAALAERLRGVLAPLIAVRNDGLGLACGDRHVQRGQHEFGAHGFAGRPADDAAAPDIDDPAR